MTLTENSLALLSDESRNDTYGSCLFRGLTHLLDDAHDSPVREVGMLHSTEEDPEVQGGRILSSISVNEG